MGKISPSQKVYDYIIECVHSKMWLPGQKIYSEKELGNLLGASRVAVRNAVSRLVGVGILVQRQGSGTYVAEFSGSSVFESFIPIVLIEKKELLSLLEFRIQFETGNLSLFMDHAGEKEITLLEESYAKMCAHAKGNNPEPFILEDFNFHKIIAQGTENVFIVKINELLTEILKNHQAHLHANIGPEIGLRYHSEILAAIRIRDKEMAVLLMKRHIEKTIEAVRRELENKAQGEKEK